MSWEPMARVGDLVATVPGARIIGDAATVIREIGVDSRAIGPGQLFAALRGADFDGHRFARGAVDRGATAVLVEQPVEVPVTQIVVGDSRAALAPLAAAFFGRPSAELPVIGITGTDGKTTTSFLVDAVLRAAGRRTGMIGTVAVRIGDEVDQHASRQTTPESVEVQRYLRRMVEAGVDWAVVEATSHGLDLHRLDDVRFRIAAVTNITHEHLEYHKTIEAYRAAKGILFARVGAAGGHAVINEEDEGAREMARFAAGSTIVRYGARGGAGDLTAAETELGPSGSTFVLRWRGRTVPVRLPMVGGFNVENALCAAGIALAAGLALEEVAAGLGAAPTIPGRLARVDAGQPFSVVVDYAHTPESLAKVLSLLRGLHPNGRLIAVFGSAGERDVEKRPLQGAAAARLADVTVVTSEDPRQEDPEAIVAQIVDGAVRAGGELGRSVLAATDRGEAVRLALGLARPGDCVLLAGKGHEGSIIWGREKRPWDEAGAARTALAELGFGGSSGASSAPGG